jgi:hypothetical protein
MMICEDDLDQTKENMKRARGGHSKPNKVKIGIIKFILQNNGPILESKIREYVENSYAIKNQKTVNTHLHDLKDLGCIERISYQKGLPNNWDITKLKHLKNLRQCFKEIKLKPCEKSINILIDELFFDVSPDNKKDLIRQLSVSVSFFNVCVETGTGIGDLYAKAEDIYKYGEGFEMNQVVEKSVNAIYNEFTKKISIPNPRSDVDTENRETFRALLEEIQIMSWGDVSAEELNHRIMSEISIKFLTEVLPKILKEIPNGSDRKSVV